MIDFVRDIVAKTGVSRTKILGWLELHSAKYHEWQQRYGQLNQHNGSMPRDWWLLPAEKEAICAYAAAHPFEGYRRLTYMMMDEDVVAVSPSTVYRVLKAEGLMGASKCKPSKKGTGFVQPLRAHEHWHVDICYINIDGTFYYMCTVIDGYSRFIVHWEIREAMREADVEIILERAREKLPDAHRRIITDNGPQFVAKDFKEYIRLSGITHVRTSPYYPQSNGKVERVQKTLKMETIRKQAPENVEQARERIGHYVDHYNHHRLHSAIDYIAPADKLAGKAAAILSARDAKLCAARAHRKTLAHTKEAA